MATYYWTGAVNGGTGTWDASSTANWSATSGGAGGAGVPTAADIVIIDANGGTGTITIGVGAVCLTSNVGAYTGTLAFGTNKISVAGNATTVFTGGIGYAVTGTPVIELTYSGSTGTRIFQSGGTMTEAKSLSLKVIAGSDTVQLANTAGRGVRDLDFTGFSGTMSFSSTSSFSIFGSLTFSAGMTLSSPTVGIQFLGTSGSYTITSNGKTLDCPLLFNGAGGTWKLIDNMTTGSVRQTTLTSGSLDLNGKTLTTGIFNTSNSNTRSISTGSITLTGNGATILSAATLTGFTLNGSVTVNATYAGNTGTRSFNWGSAANGTESTAVSINVSAGSDTVSLTATSHVKNFNTTGFSGICTPVARFYGDVTFAATHTISSGASGMTFAATSGSYTFTTAGITIRRPVTFNCPGATYSLSGALTMGGTSSVTLNAGTIKLQNGTTNYSATWNISGSPSVTLQSTVNGSQATVSQPSGVISATNATIKDINATGGATWNAFVTNGNIDGGNNTGWDFNAFAFRYIYTRRKNKVIFPF